MSIQQKKHPFDFKTQYGLGFDQQNDEIVVDFFCGGGGAGDPAPTITTKDSLGLVTVTIKGTPYVIDDICLRMLQPAEFYKAQGFPADYIISHGADGKPFTKTQQVHMCGNSVSPPPMVWRAIERQAFAA